MKDIEIKATEDEKVTEKSWSVILSLFLHLEILRGGSGIPSKHMFHDADRSEEHTSELQSQR